VIFTRENEIHVEKEERRDGVQFKGRGPMTHSVINVEDLQKLATAIFFSNTQVKVCGDAFVTIAQWRRTRDLTSLGYPQVPGSIPAKTTSIQVNRDLSK